MDYVLVFFGFFFLWKEASKNGKKKPIIFSNQDAILIFHQITFYLFFQFRLINYQLPAGHRGDFSLLSMA